MTNKSIYALTLLQSQLNLNDGEEVIVSITNNNVTIADTSDILNIKQLRINSKINPLQDLINHVNEEMCNDCLKSEYYYRDPFFKSLVKAYIDGLVYEFGDTVPITRTLAHAIVEHKLSEHEVYVFIYDKYIRMDDHELAAFNEKYEYKFFLKCKQN